MRAGVRALLAALAIAGAGAEVWAVRSGWSWVSAAFDLLAGWSLLAAAGWARQGRDGGRALLVLSGMCWFLATPQVAGGTPGRVAAQLGAVWLAPLATALLGWPGAVPARPLQRAAATAACVRALPVLAGIGWLTAGVGTGLVVAALVDTRSYAVRVPRWAAVCLGGVLTVAGVLQAVAGRGSAAEILVAVTVAGGGLAVLAAGPASAATDSGLAGLVVDLGQARDALSLERRLARAAGDPRLRLLYRLAPGLPWVTVSGGPAGDTPGGRVRTVLGGPGPAVAALEHERSALDDPRLREAVLAVGRLAARRLLRAADAAQQSVSLAASRRRLVQAETAARQQFGTDVAAGPALSLARCLAVLGEALAAAPPGLVAEVAAAQAAGQAAGTELARIAAGDAGRVLAEGGLAAALAELARSAGAEASLRLEVTYVDGAVAAAAWFAAAEAVTNALKHAGPARIWLSAATGDGWLRVQVRDDGTGGADPQGRGLRGLADRLAEHGGRLVVAGGEPGGTAVTAELPLGLPRRGLTAERAQY